MKLQFLLLWKPGTHFHWVHFLFGSRATWQFRGYLTWSSFVNFKPFKAGYHVTNKRNYSLLQATCAVRALAVVCGLYFIQLLKQRYVFILYIQHTRGILLILDRSFLFPVATCSGNVEASFWCVICVWLGISHPLWPLNYITTQLL